MHGILLDIEGTTTPIRFVYDVLFPYARRNLAAWFEKNGGCAESDPDLRMLRSELEDDRRRSLSPPEDLVQYSLWLMDLDRKSTGLKSIQGRIWADGYEKGELRGEVFPDVPLAFRAWHDEGTDVRIFSSGSILAQKLLFSHSNAGDLTKYLRGYFDTITGPKTEAASYARIALEMARNPSEIVFVSDVVNELDAASAAGMAVLLCLRPGNRPQPQHPYKTVQTLEKIVSP
jgi:enolase-phosphatase E1